MCRCASVSAGSRLNHQRWTSNRTHLHLLWQDRLHANYYYKPQGGDSALLSLCQVPKMKRKRCQQKLRRKPKTTWKILKEFKMTVVFLFAVCIMHNNGIEREKTIRGKADITQPNDIIFCPQYAQLAPLGCSEHLSYNSNVFPTCEGSWKPFCRAISDNGDTGQWLCSQKTTLNPH